MAGVELGGAVSAQSVARRGRTTASGSRRSSAASARPTRSRTRSVRCDRCPLRCTSWRRRSRSRSRSRRNSSRARSVSTERASCAATHRAVAARSAASRCRSCTTRSTARSGWRPRWTRAVTAGRATCRGASAARPPRCCSAGMLGLCLGTYSLLDTSTPRLLGAPMLALGVALVGRGTRARRPARPPHAVPARPVATPRVGHRDLGSDRGGDRDRGQRPRRERAQPVALPARVADAAADPARRHPVRARARRVHTAAAARRPSGRPRPPRDARAATGGSCRVIRFEHVTITYPDADRTVLRDVDLAIPAGELCLVVGATGTGKSTLLGAVNGLVPHFTGGTLRGRVTVDGRDTQTYPPRELADVVGVVTQDPLAGCVTDTLEEELAYGMEQLAIEPGVMRKRVEETLDLLGLAELRHRALHGLSGGQLQRVAIGAVLTAHPKVLVLDEPTSALDPTGAEEVLAAITAARARPRRDRRDGRAPARTGRAVRRPRRLPPGRRHGRVDGEPGLVLEPRVGRAADRRARRTRALAAAAALGARRAAARAASSPTELAGVRPPAVPDAARGLGGRDAARAAASSCASAPSSPCATSASTCAAGRSPRSWAATARESRRCCGRCRAPGPVRADMSTSAARDPAGLEPARARRLVGMVPHNPSDLLYLDSVGEELAHADAEAARANRHDRDSRSIASRPASPTTRTHAISRRASGSRSCSRSSSRRRRSCCCSTSPRAGSTTAPSTTSACILARPRRRGPRDRRRDPRRRVRRRRPRTG